MPQPQTDPRQSQAPRRSRPPVGLVLAVLGALPGVALGSVGDAGLDLAAPAQAAVYGLAIVCAAFLLSWAAEAAQVDISAGLAIAVLALIAVLPEYAVDFVFTWRGGQDFAQHGVACAPPDAEGATNCGLALANMTGANRILVGIGWSMVVLLAAFRMRGRPRARGDEPLSVGLDRSEAVPVAFLVLASVYALSLPLRSSVTLVDCVVLVGILVAYTVRVAQAPPEEPDLEGSALWIGSMGARGRRTGYLLLFAFAATVILLTAHHFADALVESGEALGVSEFVLVQWVAPLASEAPELLVAGLYAWRLKTTQALSTLVSSKVNQWTLLVGTLPLVFTIATFAAQGQHADSLGGLPVDAEQREELLLTAAQSLFAIALLVRLRINVRGAAALLALFFAQSVLALVVPERFAAYEIIGLSAVYLVLAAVLFVRHRSELRALLRDGFRTPVRDLADER